MNLDKVEFLKLAREESKGYNILIEFFIFLAVFVVGTCISVIVSLPIFLRHDLSTDLQMFFNLITTGVTIIVVILFCRFIEKRSLASMGFVKDKFFKNYLKGLLLGFILYTLALIISILLGGTKILGFSKDINYFYLFLTFIGFLIQGMSEEVICRGYLMVSIGRKNGLLVGAIANSVIFAMLHLANSGLTLISFINLILVGMVFSFIMIDTGNIWTVGAVHSMWNFAQGNIFGGAVSGMDAGTSLLISEQIGSPNLINGGIFGIEGSLGTTIILGITFLILIKRLKNKSNISAINE